MYPRSRMHHILCQFISLIFVCASVISVVMLTDYEAESLLPFGKPQTVLRRQPAFADYSRHIQGAAQPSMPSVISTTSVDSNKNGEPPRPPKQRIVFLKTHKTASTTMASIIERYGYYRNLTFAVGKSGHILSFRNKFKRGREMSFPGLNGRPFDMLANHARYNRPELDSVVPNATYITIIRKPEDQIDSAFGYFEMYKGMGLAKDPNSLKSFMADPMKYYKHQKYHMWQLSRNGMLFDLGFDHKYDEDRAKVLEKILELATEFDLVLLTEYFDESLVLMKNILCWDYEDILYFPHGHRSESHKYKKDRGLIAKLRAWSNGDVLLHDFFNKTFWNKAAVYGPTFGEDVAYFRNMNKALFDECIAEGELDKTDRRVDGYTLKNQSEKCVSMLRGDVDYTAMIRKSMEERFGSKP